MYTGKIDWSKHTWPVDTTVYCRCGGVFRSHTKMIVPGGKSMILVSRLHCPSCGQNDNIRRASSDPITDDVCVDESPAKQPSPVSPDLTIDGLAATLKSSYKAPIVEADEWRPLATYIIELIKLDRQRRG